MQHTETLWAVFRPLLALCLLAISGCSVEPTVRALAPYPKFGVIRRLDPRFDLLVPKEAQLEKLAEGFHWSEGPVWIPRRRALLFSDVPENVIYQWREAWGFFNWRRWGALTEFLRPSGYSGEAILVTEPGSNGLLRDPEGRLVVCEHGDRRITRYEKNGKKTILADQYQGKRLNSPNDGVFSSRGDLYFTDPPYGLLSPGLEPEKAPSELGFNGVYRLSSRGELALLTKEISFPNGIALSPDEKRLYVACSDKKKAAWHIFDLQPDGSLANRRELYSAQQWVDEGKKGLPDGMKVDKLGNLFATGPGGLHVFSPDGALLGTIDTGEANGNCCFGDDGSSLFICADEYLCRIRLSTKGLGF